MTKCLRSCEIFYF